MSEEIDPEVLADLQLRKASEYDSTRTRGLGVYAWKPPADVAQWPCRRPGCGAMVGVTQDTVDYLAMTNRWIAEGRLVDQLDKRPLASDAVVLCADCRVLLEKMREEKSAARRAETRDLVQRMKASPNPRNEHELIKRLSQLHHPDVTGLIESLAAKLESGANKTARAKGKKL